MIRQKTEQKYKSYIGTKINMLTIKDFIYDKETDCNHRYMFLCDCDCGTKDKLIQSNLVIKSKIKSCGCSRTGIRPETEQKYKSYIGQKFGKLTITNFVYNKDINDYHERFKFLCNCDCGTKDKLITCYQIIRKNQKSCGCLIKTGIRPETEQKYKSYIGQKFGKLTITNFVYNKDINDYHERFKFLCNCDCSTKDKLILCHEIINNYQRSCGCSVRTGLRSETKERYRSYIGQKNGKLIIKDFVYDESEIAYSNRYKFLCDCYCGVKDTLILCNGIINNNQQTCGCSRSFEIYQELIEHCKKHKLKLLDDYTTIKNNNSICYNDYLFKCLVCNVTFSKKLTSFPICPHCNPNCASNAELIISEFLLKNNIVFIKQMINSVDDIQQRVEIDFLVNNIGIELHGLGTHATTYNFDMINNMFVSKPKNYHLNKLESAEAQNINLLQFWNTELYQKFKIVKSIILNRLNETEHSEYARKCYVKEIDKSISDQFLEKHHIQGSVRNDSVRLGLFHKKTDNLVSVMTFGTARFSEHEWELYRFATYINCRVVGAAGKLFKHFIRNYNPSSIVSYSDRRLFNSGKLYSTLGFKLDHISAPNYWYFEKNKTEHNARLYHRVQFQKHKLSKILGVFDSSLTEWQNMENNNYLRIYDCGNKVYVYKKNY